MIEKLKTAARALAYMYRGLKEWKRREAEVAEAYKATLEYQAYEEVVNARKSLQVLTRAVEGDTRNLVLENYAATKDKKPAPGLGVRVSKGKAKLVYTDEVKALMWLRENAIGALQPDSNVVQAMIAAGTEIPGAHIVNEGAGVLTATITGASKLINMYLEED